jgi:hypothetical protein
LIDSFASVYRKLFLDTAGIHMNMVIDMSWNLTCGEPLEQKDASAWKRSEVADGDGNAAGLPRTDGFNI